MTKTYTLRHELYVTVTAASPSEAKEIARQEVADVRNALSTRCRLSSRPVVQRGYS